MAKNVEQSVVEETSLTTMKTEVNSLTLRIQKMEVVSQETLEVAADLLKNLIIVKKKVETLFDPQIDASYKSWQIALQQKKNFIGPLTEAEKSIKKKTGDYIIEQNRVLEEKRLKAEEEARKKEEKLKAKLAKKIEKTEDSETRAILEEQMENTVVQPETAYMPNAVKVNGMVQQKDWKIEVVDKRKLLKAVLNDEVVVDIDNLVDVKIGVLKTYLKNSGRNSIAGCIVKPAVIQKFK